MAKNGKKNERIKRLSLKQKEVIDFVLSGSSYVEASLSVYPGHKGWAKNRHCEFVSRIIHSELGQQYYQEKVKEIEAIKKDELKDRYKNPLWSFEDSVNNLKMIIDLAKQEMNGNLARYIETQAGSILTPTCVNAILNAITTLNKMYRYDTPDQASPDDSKLSFEKELLALKAEKEKLQLEKELIMLDREKGEICYNDVAVSEFSKVIKVVYDSVVRIPATLSSENEFTIEQKATIMKVVESILESLSNVRVELSSANTIDKKLSEMSSHSSKASKKKQVQK